MANVWEIPLSPTAFQWTATSGVPAFGVAKDRDYIAFDASTVEAAKSVWVAVPQNYAGGTVKVTLYLIAASATSGKFDFDVSVEAVTAADAVDLDAGESFDSANSGDVTVGSTAGHLFTLTITLTNKDSMAAGDYLRIKVERDADDGTNDTATGDAHLLGALLFEEA